MQQCAAGECITEAKLHLCIQLRQFVHCEEHVLPWLLQDCGRSPCKGCQSKAVASALSLPAQSLMSFVLQD